jgi:hypothetical protein
MPNRPDISVELALENQKFKRQLQDSVGFAQRSFGDLTSIAGLTSKALAGIGAGLSVAGIASFVKDGINAADQMSKLAQRAGVTTEAFSRLSFAAELADVSTESLQAALTLLGRKADEAARGGKTAADQFQRLGVSVKNSDGSLKSVEVLFGDVSDAISKLPDGAEKSARAMGLLGRSGAQLVPLLNGGAAGLREAGEEARRFGLVVSTEAGRSAEEFNDNLTRLGKAIQGVSIELGGELVGGLANLSTEFVKAYTEGDGLLRVFTSLGSAISRALGGNDQEQLGALLLKEIELERAIANTQAGIGAARGNRIPGELKRLQADLDETRKKAEGLRAVLQPEQYGAAPVEKPRVQPPRIVEDEVASAAAAKELQSDRERLIKAQDSYLGNLRKQLELQGEVNELAQVEADIKVGAAREFDKATQDELRQIADKVDRLNEEAEVHEYLLKLEQERREEAAKTTRAISDERARTLESLRSPEEQYSAEVRKLLELGIGGEDLQRGIDKARDSLEAARDTTKETAGAARELGFAFESAFESAIFEADNFGDILKGLLQDLVKIGIRSTVTDPLANLAKDAFGSLFSGGGGGLLGDLKGLGLFGNANGGLYRVGGSGTGERPVMLTAQPGEGIAVGHFGGGGGNTVVNVINPPAQPKVRETVIDGEKKIDIVFQGSFGRSLGRGDLASVGLPPPLASR